MIPPLGPSPRRYSPVLGAGLVKSEPLNSRILAIAAPTLVALSLDPLLSTVDTAFVGSFAEDPSSALATLAVGGAIFSLAFSCTNFFGSAATPLVSAKRLELGEGSARRFGNLIALVGLALGIAVLAATEAAMPQLVSAIVQQDQHELYEHAVVYCRIRALSAPAVVAISALNGVLRGLGDAQAPLRAAFVATVINLALDVILVVHLGFGANGAAAATCAAESVAALYLLHATRGETADAGPADDALEERSLEGDATDEWRESLAPFWGASLLTLARTLSLQLFLAATTGVVGSGADGAQLAAHHILKQVYTLLSFATDALAVAAQTLIAGAEEPAARRHVAHRVILWGLLLGAAFAIALFVGAGLIVDLLTSDEHVRALAESELRSTVAPLQIVSSFVFVGDGVMQGYQRFSYEAKAMIICSGTALVALFWALPALHVEMPLDVAWDAVVVLQVGRAAAVVLFLVNLARSRDEDSGPGKQQYGPI